jgi:hypothetical protein
MMSLDFVRNSREVLELALIGKQFGKRPSELFGILDRGVALDFDRLCSQRLLFYDLERAKAEADAMKGTKEPDSASLFDSNEMGKFGPPDGGDIAS